MELLLSQNIRANRKRLELTQEQLAEAMNVSVGTVSKWENGSCAPDIGMIVELADFFQESVDALLGYQWRHRSAGQTAEYLRALKVEHRYEEGRAQIRKVLQKFPNHPEVLYECAELLYESAVMRTNPGADDDGEAFRSCLEQTLDLYRKVIRLLEQKDSPALNRVKIRQKIGVVYGILGRMEEAVTYLREHNVFDLNDWIISNFLAELGQYDRAWDTVTAVFQHRVFELFQCCQIMYSVLINSGKYDELLRLAFWMEGFCRSVQDERNGYYVRAEAITDAMIAAAFVYRDPDGDGGDFPDAGHWLRRAVENAERFDAAPDYSGKTRFTGHVSESVYDGHRESAILAVQDVILGCREDGKAFSVLQKIYDDIVSGIGHDEWRLCENNEKSAKKFCENKCSEKYSAKKLLLEE